MNKDNSIEKIDLVKLLLWVSVFLITIFVLSALLIIPSLNKLKSANEVLQSSNSKLNYNTSKKDNLENKLNEYLTTHKISLDKLHKDFDLDEFKSHCKNFFDDVNIEKSVNFSDEYVSYQLSVSTKITSPSVFYDFIDSLEDYPNIIRVHFPIVLKSDKEMIKAQFDLQVYKR